MASTFASYFGLRSTVAYTSAGAAITAGSVFTVSSNVGPTWSNTLTVSSFSTLLGSTITVSTLRYQSTAISLGASTNQSYSNFSNGSYTTGWGSTLSGLTAVQKIAMSYSGQYQYAAQNGSSTINTSVNSGVSWVSITGANGLPAGATAYPLTTAAGTPNYTSVSASATGQYILASVRGGLLYTCANGTASVPTFTAVGMGTPTYYLPLENSVADVVGSSAPAVTGSVTYTTGVVGTYAAVISNTAAGTASNYIRGTMSNTTVFTVSGWLNLQSIPGSGSISAITVIGGSGNSVAISYFNNYTMNSILYNGLMFFFYNTGGSPIVVGNFPNVSINTWYSFTYIFSATGTCYAYVNGALVGSVAGQAIFGGTISTYGIGCGVTNTAQAFNGYIDDYRLYNWAVPYSPIVPMNWSYTAVSGSGQYMLAAATGGGLFMSSNYGASWSQVATSITNPLYTGLGMSYSGQYMLAVGGSAVTPQQSGLAAASWTQGGVSWATSASSQYSTFAPQSAFNSSTATTWASNSGTYNGSGAWTGSVAAVTIQGVGSISGEWLQLQSNVGLLMQSYTFSCGGPVSQTPKTYYIIGSNDGSTWYPIQYVSMGSNPYTTNYSVASTYITTNQSGSQNLVVGANTAVLTCTTYSTTVNTYTYFRILVTTTHGGGVVEIGEWYINFANGQNYSTNYGNSWNRLSLNGATQTFGALSGNGQYALTGTGQIAYLVSNYLAGFSTNTYTTLTLSGINANISGADISATGQYMTIITQGTTNNVYYSTNYGATFTALTVGSAAMTDCSISADGSYITVSNATTVYTLNRNTQGYGVSIGNAAGSVNQGQHAIAIGNSAGVTNQPSGSIILNSSGSTLDAYNSGFYVSNISDYGTSYAPSFSLLGYGSDKQVVQGSAITLLSSGNVGIGTTNPASVLQINDPSTSFSMPLTMFAPNLSTSSSQYILFGKSASNYNQVQMGFQYVGAGSTSNYAFLQFYGTSNTICWTGNGTVGIGTTLPGYALHVIGAIYASGNITALSDQRYKQNVIRLSGSLDTISRLSGYSYIRTDESSGKRHIGLIAQEVNTVLPEAVSYDVSNDTYSINYGCMIAPVIEAIKELNQSVQLRIAALEATVARQERTIQELKRL